MSVNIDLEGIVTELTYVEQTFWSPYCMTSSYDSGVLQSGHVMAFSLNSLLFICVVMLVCMHCRQA